MTIVHVRLSRGDGSPFNGHLTMTPSRRHANGYVLVTEAAFNVPLNGTLLTDIDMAPTASDWCWHIQENVAGGAVRFVAVPGSGPVEYEALTDVDPKTLSPAALPEAAWWAALDNVVSSTVGQGAIDARTITAVASTATTAGALLVNEINPVDATSGPLTMTLPTGKPAGSLIVVEKEDGTTNAVTVSGSIRGVGSSTLALTLQKESIQFAADASGSWWPAAGHKTLSSIRNDLTGSTAGSTAVGKALAVAASATAGRTALSAVGLGDLVINANDPAYGADPTGAADSTAAITAVFAAANALVRDGLTGTIKHPGCTVLLRGTYNLSTLAAPINIMCNVDSQGATFIIPAAYAGVAVLVGHATSGSWLQSANITMPDVMKPSSTLTPVAGSVGVRVQNLGSSVVKFGRVAYFETGHHYTGLGNGTVYNNFYPGWISYCKIAMSLLPLTGGWVNQNDWFGGGVQQSPTWPVGIGTRATGYRHVVLDGGSINPVNGNNFYGTSFEGDVSEYALYLHASYQNNFHGCRFESGTVGAAVTVSGATITATAHGLAVGDVVVFAGIAEPGGMVFLTPYYVVTVIDANSYSVSQKKAGTAITFTTAGTTVTFVHPQRIYFDMSGTGCSNNRIHYPITPLYYLDVVSSSTVAAGNGVETAINRIADYYSEEDLPRFRARNAYTSATKRPLFAAYAPTVNPLEDPNGWTTALSDRGIVYGSAGTELGVVGNSGGVLQYKLPADSVAYELATSRRSPGLITITSLSCAANTTTSTTFTQTGASTSEHCLVTPLAAMTAGLALSHAYVSAANTVTVVFANLTGSTIVQTVNLQCITFRRFF